MARSISLGQGKKPVYPTKTTINLMEVGSDRGISLRMVGLFFVALVVILLFAKFAVIDVLGSVSKSNASVARAQSQLTALEQNNANYDDLQKQYNALAINSLSDAEKSFANRADVLELLRSTVAASADLRSVGLSENTVVLQFANTSLDEVSRVVASLENDDLVASVNVSTARTDRNDDVVSTVEIMLNGDSPAKESEV